MHPIDRRQPWLHDLSVCVDGNVTALSASDGEMDGSGAHGVFVDDRRVVSISRILVGGLPVTPVGHSSSGACSEFLGCARQLGNPGADPTVEVHRLRRAAPTGVTERVSLVSRASAVVESDVALRIAGDGADISAVKSGHAQGVLLTADGDGHSLTWEDDRHAVRVESDCGSAQFSVDPAGGGWVRLPVRVEPGAEVHLTVTVTVARTRTTNLDAGAGSASVDWSAISADAQDSALGRTVAAAMDDLRHLLLTDPVDPGDVFAAAGTPWYLTLFGRDSLWTARMMLPFGTDLALGTLRALGRRQGTVVDRERAEEPGKIPHELRRTEHSDPGSTLALPAAYYGTVDATALWLSVLHDAWRWGLPLDEVRALLPNLRAAATWLTETSAPDADGLLKYVDDTGTGLTNQGWKDSGDSIRWRDGRIAAAPIALVEAQAYAVEAATGAAALLDALGEPGAGDLIGWAAALRERVRERFWVGHEEPGGPWLGIAVDGAGRTVDGLASNMGHVLGTGTLTQAEGDRVAATLTADPLLDRFGVRTLASDNGGFNPIGYHTGSIWTHDTAICAWNLARDGHRAQAAAVSRTLLSSSVAFGHHWPELYAGTHGLDKPVAYPAACRPQAWAAASAAVLLSVALGFEPDAPGGRLVLRPARPAPYGAMVVRGLRFAGHQFAVDCAADGTATVLGAPPGLVEVV